MGEPSGVEMVTGIGVVIGASVTGPEIVTDETFVVAGAVEVNHRRNCKTFYAVRNHRDLSRWTRSRGLREQVTKNDLR